jgi:catechol-2,3-dioxygenase
VARARIPGVTVRGTSEEGRLSEVRWPRWIGVVTDDVDRQVRFYRDVLGFPEAHRSDGWVQLDAGDGRLIEITARSDEDPRTAKRGYQVGFAVDDIAAERGRLIAAGCEPLGGIDGGEHSGSRWCYLRDPEGNVFELTQDL